MRTDSTQHIDKERTNDGAQRIQDATRGSRDGGVDARGWGGGSGHLRHDGDQRAAASDPSLAVVTAASPSPGTQPNGKFVPNEDPTHEKGESAAREAQENAGQVPTVP